MDTQNVNTEHTSPGRPDEVERTDRSARLWNIIFWGTVITLSLLLVFETILKPFRPLEFTYLAQNFAAGHLYADGIPNITADYVLWQGHIYLPMGPLPAVVLIPFLPLIQAGLQPAWISVIITALNVWLFYLIFEKMGITGDRQRWTLLLFFGGTVYFGLAATMNSWFFAQVLGTTCLLLAILEAVGRKRPFIIGLLIGLAAGARITYLFSLPFFIALFWQGSGTANWRSRLSPVLRKAVFLGLGLGIPMLLLFWYNYARFGNGLETGYATAVVSTLEFEISRSYGLFSVVHIPTNLYYLLLQGPVPYPSADYPIFTFPYLQPTPMGMAVFFTSPALLYVFRAKLREPMIWACWLGIGAILIPLLMYEATGWITFGNRYSLDLMPFLVMIAMYGFPRPLDNRARGLIILSVMINMWGNYWLHAWLSPRP